METIHITLPDGSVKDVPKGTTAADIARGISPRLAEAAFVAKVYSGDSTARSATSAIRLTTAAT